MPPGESHVSRISKEYYVNYFNSSHRELGPPVVVAGLSVRTVYSVTPTRTLIFNKLLPDQLRANTCRSFHQEDMLQPCEYRLCDKYRYESEGTRILVVK